MRRILLTTLILLDSCDANIMQTKGLSTDGEPAIFPDKNVPTGSEVTWAAPYDNYLKKNTNPNDLPDKETANTATIRFSKNEKLTFWTSSVSTTGDSMISSTGPTASSFITTNDDFPLDTDLNVPQTKLIDWVTEQTRPVTDSELEHAQLDNDTTQIISKKTAAQLLFAFLYVLEPSVAVTGCACNLFNMFVLRKQGLDESTTCFLYAMSFADLMYLLTMLVAFVFIVLRDHFYPIYVQCALGMQFNLIHRYFVIIFGRTSNYIVAALSIERFIAVRFPFSVKFTPLSRHPKIIIAGVWLFVSALLIPNIFRTEFVIFQDPISNVTMATYTVTEFYKSHKQFFTYYTYCILALLRLIPVLVVLVLNFGIIIVLKGSKSNLINMNVDDKRRQKQQLKITRILIAIAVIFLLCVSPGLVHSLLTVFYSPYYEDNPNLWRAFRDCFPLFDIINSTVNFIVYIMLSKKFRRIVLDVFCPRYKKGEGGRRSEGYSVYNVEHVSQMTSQTNSDVT